MHILDTNHFSEIERRSTIGAILQNRIADEDVDAFVTIVTAEEVMRGWLARLNMSRGSLVSVYERFRIGIDMLSKWTILGWNQDAEDVFHQLQRMRIRVGTLDLRIASMTLIYDATLLTRNLADFRQVPGLKVENWLD
jgi:tRNA(fMet)-specific endonuclease VapC